MLEIPVKDLTLEQLHLLKVSISHDDLSYISYVMHFHFLHILEHICIFIYLFLSKFIYFMYTYLQLMYSN